MTPLEPVNAEPARLYAVVTSERTTEDGTPYTACGISYLSGETRLDDVSCNTRLVDKMVELFNLCELPLERLKLAVLTLIP